MDPIKERAFISEGTSCTCRTLSHANTRGLNLISKHASSSSSSVHCGWLPSKSHSHLTLFEPVHSSALVASPTFRHFSPVNMQPATPETFANNGVTPTVAPVQHRCGHCNATFAQRADMKQHAVAKQHFWYCPQPECKPRREYFDMSSLRAVCSPFLCYEHIMT